MNDINKPVVSFKSNYKQGINQIKWHPYQQDTIITSSIANNKLQIYNLSSYHPNQSIRSIECFNKQSKITDFIYNLSKNLILSSTTNGKVNFYDLRDKQHHQFYNKYDVYHQYITNIHSSISNEYYIYTTTTKGNINIFDLRYNKQRLYQENIYDVLHVANKFQYDNKSAQDTQLISSIIHDNESYLSFQLSNSSIGTIDLYSSKVSNLYSPYNDANFTCSHRDLSSIDILYNSHIACYSSYSTKLLFNTISYQNYNKSMTNTLFSNHIDIYTDEIFNNEAIHSIDIGNKVTATAIHPYQHYIICGTYHNHLYVLADQALPYQCNSKQCYLNDQSKHQFQIQTV